jgi:sulfate permease
MLAPMLSRLLLPLLVALFLAINMGGSGTSPAFATAYGSGILRKDIIPYLFGPVKYVRNTCLKYCKERLERDILQ